jgi:hypothetical protein
MSVVQNKAEGQPSGYCNSSWEADVKYLKKQNGSDTVPNSLGSPSPTQDW